MKIKQYHILKVISFVFIIAIITSCSSSQKSVKVGNYASEYPNRLTLLYYKYILNYQAYSMGDTLNIYGKKDFRYHTCGSNMFGKYRISKDTLFLDVDSVISHFDKKVYSDNFTKVLKIENEDYIEEKGRGKYAPDSKESFKSITRLFYINEKKK